MTNNTEPKETQNSAAAAAAAPEQVSDVQGFENNASGPAAKAKNQAKNDAKRKAKEEKFKAKQAALAAKKAAEANNNAKKKEKKDDAKPAVQPKPKFVNKTPYGEKKDLSGEMADGYDPSAVEAAWYEWWMEQGFFKPKETKEEEKVETFVIPAPPPNVTGKLHIGHALTTAIQDSLTRWNRMRGVVTLFNPGMDHAGISTQSVVEKKLWKEKKLTRHDLGREKFIDEVWKWKDQYAESIKTQLFRLGGSFDWSRERFTMDKTMSRAVLETFVTLHDQGIIYRSNKLVNWCIHLNTALSNLEVDNKEVAGRTLLSVPGYDPKEKFEFGVLFHFDYLIEGSDERLTVATTRIETMLGDAAIAVHPNDQRYKHLHGKFAVHPFCDRKIPIITDDIAVDPEFGTGAVKITPAHDFNDYQVGKRHNLPFINILNENGTFNENAGPYAGQKRFSVRKTIVEDLKAKGLYRDSTDNPMTIPVCSKSGDVIEPLMKPQWWVKCEQLAKPALEAVRSGDLTIVPKASEKEWFRWLGSIQDWCISRQLWWGHRAPAYFVNIEGQTNDPGDNSFWVVGRNREEAEERAKAKFPNTKYTLEQDPDVLDTWFSSGLWPFAILGWPEQTPDFKRFYPTTLLETGWDILFFWTARMVMLGIHLTGQIPFKNIFCHAMVRDAQGRKMSKSLGNVIDPIDVIEGISLEELHAKLEQGNLDSKEIKKAMEGQKKDYPKGIPECGTDALRFALCAYTTASRDLNLNVLRVEGYRKFCNKLWNATRFALLKLGTDFKPNPTSELTGEESLAEKWILHKLNKAATELNERMAEMNFMAATTAVYSFWLYELCDVFIEYIKPITQEDSDPKARRSAQNTLYICLDAGLRMLHPFMPYVTEELWQRLPRRPNDTTPSISIANFPEAREDFNNPDAESKFDLIMSVVRSARSLLADYGIKSRSNVFITNSSEEFHALISAETEGVRTLIKGCESVTSLSPSQTPPPGCAVSVTSDDVSTLLLVRGKVDIDQEIQKLEKKKQKVDKLYSDLEAKTKIEDYEDRIPAKVREANTEKLGSYQAEIDALSKAITNFLSLKE
ncbi:valine--tRNA ligase [Mycoemilia scoparia]|uniref:Probable valine--tRNA ligase, cytoplasmic n=1 Tax=Mycoemilia scoparia TaxID=417184 RepID=A0A9W8A276_9FUNG|nr:valine--tRNA ligase [Mycoemilia scoparia]